MNEEITNIIDEQQSESGNTGDANSYIEAIKEMRKNSVAKADYERLQAENKELMKALVNGETIAVEPQEAVDVNALRKELYVDNADMSNLEYIEKTLKLRDAIIEAGGDDPFVGAGHKFAPSVEDYEAAERVANVLKECIDYADGDSEVFTNELMRVTLDVSPTARKPQKINRR
jgi:hypothetical protein